MSAQQVSVLDASFLDSDILRILGRDGIIMMVVGCFLALVLIICCIALIVWYCKSPSSKPRDDEKRFPALGTIQPSMSRDKPAAGAGYSAAMSPSAATATTAPDERDTVGAPQGAGNGAYANGAYNSPEANVEQEERVYL